MLLKTLTFWLDRYSGRILLAALLLGAILRWVQISTHDFWYDEAVSALIARLSTIQILGNAAADDHPFGYYLLLHFWLGLGQSEAIIRSLSALVNLATVLLVYGLGRRLFDRPTAVLAALLAAVLPFQIYYAQETRFYGVVVFLSTAIIWIFLAAVQTNKSWWIWLGYAAVAALGIYTHYFVAFLIIGAHIWFLLNIRQYTKVFPRLAGADLLVAVVFVPQLGQALARTGIYLTGASWQASPSLLSPLATIYYLLFGHRTPIWMFPVALFLVLTALVLTLWETRRRVPDKRNLELFLWCVVVTPIVIVLLISWGIRPIYLDRSFAVSSTALALLLARGFMAAPRWSPTPYLIGLLAVPIGVTLVMNWVTPDPAKPPIEPATALIAADFKPEDVSLHLQDASYMPALWYSPQIPHVLGNIPGALFTTVQTHRVLGGDVVKWQSALAGKDRLWLTVMPGFVGPEQKAVFEKINATYPMLIKYDWGPVQLYLYNLKERKK